MLTIYTKNSVVDARLGSKYVSGHTSKCIDLFLPVKKFGFKLANSYPSKNGIMFCTFDKSFTLPDTPILRYTECNTCYTLFILHGKLHKHNLSYKSRNLQAWIFNKVKYYPSFLWKICKTFIILEPFSLNPFTIMIFKMARFRTHRQQLSKSMF